MTASTGHRQDFTYDSLGRPSGTVETLDGGVTLATSTVTYGAYGRVTSSTTASGQIFAYGYTNLGLTWSIAVGGGCTGGQGGCGTIFRAQTLDADGAVIKELYGNGVVTSRTIDRTRGVVTAIESKKGGTTLQKLSYQYDGFLNMTQRDDQVSRVRENFAFDILNRLTASSAERYDGTPVTYASQAVSYDAVGNITAKSDVGLYQYGAANGPRPHAVTAITPQVGGGTVNTSFTYDANGNMLTGHDRTYAWTAFDMPSTITRGAQTLAFTYGIGHQRIRQVKNGGAETIQYYGGGQAERITDATGTRWIDYVSVGGRLIGTQTRAEGAALGAGVAAYYHVDHLGSVDRITDWQGTVVEVQDYDAWGKRRFATGAPDSAGTITSTARRGFTGHEQLDSVGLVHMNGRVYDPFVARFTSADPMLQAPQNLQSHNRYSYALNNPLSYTDPSGFFNIGKFFKKVFKGIGSFLKGLSKFVFSRQGLAILVSIALMAATGGFGAAYALGPAFNLASPVLSGAIAGAAGGAISTGSLKGAIFGAVSGAIAGYIGGLEIGDLSGFGLDAARGGILGFTEGAIAETQGGDFRTGFFSAAFASIAGAQAGKLLPANDVAAQLIGRSVVGGTASVIGGGKFANGAYSAAFNYAVEMGVASIGKEITKSVKSSNQKPSVIFVGGAGDADSKIVFYEYEKFKNANIQYEVNYFSWDQGSEISSYIKSLPSSSSVTVIGHSYGADTAVIVVAALAGKIDAIITIDPVGSAGNRSYLEKVAANASVWVNVNATGGSWAERSNLIAGLGGAYNSVPGKYASNHYDAPNSNHADFVGMKEVACKNHPMLRAC